nr:hypothetical protein [Tanacetum cinerariifolium]
VMAAPTISISVDSFEEIFEDTIDIAVDVTHPVPVALAIFSTAMVVMSLAQYGKAIWGIHENLLQIPIQEELRALRDKVKIAEPERATLRATIRKIWAVKMSLRKRIRDERQTRMEIKRQLASVQESYRQDREDFKKIKDFMTSQFGYR